MPTYKQLFSTTKSGRLTAASKRAMREFIDTRGQYSHCKLSNLLPTERTCNYRKPAKFANCVLIALSKKYKQFAHDIYRDHAGYAKSNVQPAEPDYWTRWVETSFEYRGSWQGYHGSYITPKYRSFSRIFDDGAMIGYAVGALRGSVMAPRGHYWAVSGGKLALVHKKTRVEYHVDCEQVSNWSDHKAAVIDALALNAKRRAEAQRQAHRTIDDAVRLAGNAEITLTIAKRAGNCESGIRDFAALIGVNPDSRYTVRFCVQQYRKNYEKTTTLHRDRFQATLRWIANSFSKKAA